MKVFFKACDSSCSTCAGSSTFCLSCPNNQLAAGGKCVQSCPSGTFSASGACLTCHPDCSSCSGASFNQCTGCPSSRPVLTNGRCLATCAKSEWFDTASSSCQPCDSSCASCTGRGAASCLSCSSSSKVLHGGSCVDANCRGTPNVVPGLGVCLSNLVFQTSSSTGAAPLPSVTGLDSATIVKSRRLEWWEILLMALGCAFIFLVVIWLFRRRQKKKRAEKTALFSAGAVNRGQTSWRWKLIRFGEKLFGHNRSRRVVPVVRFAPPDHETEESKLLKLRAAEEAILYNPPVRPPRPSAEDVDMVNLISSYNFQDAEPSRYYSPHSRGPSPHQDRYSSDNSSVASAPSLYSQMTGAPRRVPDPREPVKESKSRWSAVTFDLMEVKKKSRNPFRRS